jgi:hypothetical protein
MVKNKYMYVHTHVGHEITSDIVDGDCNKCNTKHKAITCLLMMVVALDNISRNSIACQLRYLLLVVNCGHSRVRVRPRIILELSS